MDLPRRDMLPRLDPVVVRRIEQVQELDLPIKLQDIIIQDAEQDVQRLCESLSKVEAIGMIKGAWCKRFTFGKAQEILSTLRFLRMELRRREQLESKSEGH